MRGRLYGTNLIVMPSVMSATAEEIAAAAERLGGLPVRLVARRPLLRWVVIISAGLAAGILASVFWIFR
jgi:hypothetical protein